VIIDVHTHMMSASYLDALKHTRDSPYEVRANSVGAEAVFRGDTAFVTLTPEMFDWEARLRDMDQAGVDLSVVSLTCPNVYWGGRETSLRTAIAINDDMGAACDEVPDRLKYFASLPWEYADDAIAELRRSHSAGAVGVMVLANINGAPLTEERFAPVWAEIDRLALPVLVHPTAPPGLEAMSLSDYHLVWSAGFTFDTCAALARMIMDGFFDRYPRLKIIGGHAGGYLPFLISRLDKGFEAFPQCRTRIDRKPSSYLSQIHVDSIVYSRAALDFTVQTFGAENVLFGSDYPHKNGRMEEIAALIGTLPARDRELIGSANAADLLGIAGA
jgi:aminocarboxymuconate-semialdehyde decarboxylase